MTVEEFMAEFEREAPRRTWRLEGHLMRSEVSQFERLCPITALALVSQNSMFPIGKYLEAGFCLGLNKEDVTLITRAADGRPEYNKALRARLLTACGLMEIT